MTDQTPTPPESSRFTTIELEDPLTRGETQIASITLRKPTAGELRGLKLDDLVQNEVTTLLKLIPRISDPILTEDEASRLSFSDIVQCGGAISGFFLTKDQREFRDRWMAEQQSKV